MAKKSAPTKKTPKAKKPLYIATFRNLGKTYTASGPTAYDAITALKPLNPKGIAVVTIEYEGRKRERILSRITVARLFSLSGLAREIALKSSGLLFTV